MSKRTEATKALRDMNDAELDEHLHQQRRKLFEMRFQQATGQVENRRQIRDIRREIARTMTVQIQLQRVAAVPEEAMVKPAGPVSARASSRPRAKRAPVPSLAGHPPASTPSTPEAEPADAPQTEADDE